MCLFVESTCRKLQEQYNVLVSLLESKNGDVKINNGVNDDELEEVSYFSIKNQASVRRLIQRHPPINHDRMAWLSSSDDSAVPPLPPRAGSMT